MEWLVIDNHAEYNRGGTRVSNALQQYLPNSRIIPPPKDRTKYSTLYKYVESKLGIVQDEWRANNVRIISNIGFTPPVPGHFAYVHCPYTRRMTQSSIEYVEQANAEVGLVQNVHPIRQKIRKWIDVFTYHQLQTKHAKTTKFLANSMWGKDVICTDIPQAKNVVVVYPPCNIPNISEVKKSNREIDVISVGAITPYKRHHAAINICARSRSAKNVLIIGYAYDSYPEKLYLKKLQELAVRINNNSTYKDNRFIINTFCNDDAEKHMHMHNAKCVISAHWHEHFGIAVVEAMARGCIPVVPDAMGFKETVPFAPLRFSDETDEAPRIMDDVLNGTYDDLVPKLRAHASKFSQEVFRTAIKREVLSDV